MEKSTLTKDLYEEKIRKNLPKDILKGILFFSVPIAAISFFIFNDISWWKCVYLFSVSILAGFGSYLIFIIFF